MRISSWAHVVWTSCIGPPMMKNKSFVPAFFRARARISEPVTSAMAFSYERQKGKEVTEGNHGFPLFVSAEARAEGERRFPLDDLVVAQRSYLRVGHPEPVLERLAAVLAKQRCGFHRGRAAVEAHRPACHLERAVGRMANFLNYCALLEVRVVQELLR